MDSKPKPVPLGTERLAANAGGEGGSAVPAGSAAVDKPLKERVIEALKTCYDPEIPVNIYELGLIYDLDVPPSGVVSIRMTLTSPACPVAGSLPGEVASKVRAVAGVTDVKVDLVWEPPWEMERMSEAAKLQLGMF